MRPLFRTTQPSLTARHALFVLPLISSAGTAADGAARILSVYHGLEEVTLEQCAGDRSAVEPQDGMPLVFSFNRRRFGLAIGVCSANQRGTRVTPLCATLRPALNLWSSAPYCWSGEFSPGDAAPARVEGIVGVTQRQAGQRSDRAACGVNVGGVPGARGTHCLLEFLRSVITACRATACHVPAAAMVLGSVAVRSYERI